MTAAQSTDAVTSTIIPDALASAKSPTFDVACGTDLEFHSRFFDVDDGGLLRQLSADDVVEILRRREPSSSSSLSSPTCDVACNTEHDSRPCTPARVNYSRYYAQAAVEPPPPTAVDVACGPDLPSTTDVGCGTQECAAPFQTSAGVDVTTRQRPETERQRPVEVIDSAVITNCPPLSQDQGSDTLTTHQPESVLELSATTVTDERRQETDATSVAISTSSRQLNDEATVG